MSMYKLDNLSVGDLVKLSNFFDCSKAHIEDMRYVQGKPTVVVGTAFRCISLGCSLVGGEWVVNGIDERVSE